MPTCARSTSGACGPKPAVHEARDLPRTSRFSAQELKVRRETLLEQFAATRLELADVVAALVAGGRRRRPGSSGWRSLARRSSGSAQVNLAAIDEFTRAVRAQGLPRPPVRRPHRRADDARGRDPQDRPRNPQRASRTPSTASTPASRRSSRGCSAAATPTSSWPATTCSSRGRGHGAAAGQAQQLHLPALGRREGADRRGAGVLDLRAEPGAVLPAGRGGRAARREQRRPLLRDRARDVRAGCSSSSSRTTRPRWSWPTSCSA